MTWTLPVCATNAKVWNPRGTDTRAISRCARDGEVLAVNEHGTVALYDIANAADVKPLGRLRIAALDHDEDMPLAFRDGTLLVGTAGGVCVLDVSTRMKPRLRATYDAAPRRRHGWFVGDVYYSGSRDVDGLYAQRVDGKAVVAFATDRGRFRFPSGFARVGDTLLVIGTNHVESFPLVDRIPLEGSVATKRKKIDTAADGDVYTLPDGLVAIVTGGTGFGVRVIDALDPTNPKVQSRIMKAAPRGSGLAGTTLLVVHHDNDSDEEAGELSLTRIELGRPKSVAGRGQPLIRDPDLGTGLVFVEPRGKDLLVLSRHGRFALLRPPRG